MERIYQFDRNFFRLINERWHNDWFDALMPWLRNSTVWYPLYFFMFVLIIFNIRKNLGWLILCCVLTVVITDQVSSTLIKGNVQRIRPCAEELLVAWRRSLVGCPGNSSFTSSHATNHFGIAMFFYMTLKDSFGKWMMLFFPWAFAVCYAQVYVGVHYPIDVISGAALGLILGFLTAVLYRYLCNKFPLDGFRPVMQKR